MTGSNQTQITGRGIQVFPSSFFVRQVLFLLVAAALFLGLSWYDRLDFWISAQWYQVETHSFPLKDNFWLELINHKLLKFSIIASAVAALFWGIYRKNPRLVVAMVLLGIGTAVVGALKASSIHSCPWSLSEFGGQAAYLHLFESASTGVNPGPGKCFPGGHSSCGFAVMALFFLFYPERPKLAWCCWLLGIFLGMVMGYGQVMRGAHFLSHNLWAGWWVWLSQLGCYWLVGRITVWRRQRY